MDISRVFFGVLFSAVGLLFALGRLHGHIPAWKAMPDEEKAKISIMPLCRNIGGMIGLCGVLFLLGGVCPGFSGRAFTGAMIAWLVAAGLDVWRISRSGRYQEK